MMGNDKCSTHDSRIPKMEMSLAQIAHGGVKMIYKDQSKHSHVMSTKNLPKAVEKGQISFNKMQNENKL